MDRRRLKGVQSPRLVGRQRLVARAVRPRQLELARRLAGLMLLPAAKRSARDVLPNAGQLA